MADHRIIIGREDEAEVTYVRLLVTCSCSAVLDNGTREEISLTELNELAHEHITAAEKAPTT